MNLVSTGLWMTAVALGMVVLPGRAFSDEHSIVTYHADMARSGNFIVPALTWERARSLHWDEGFHPSVTGQVYAQPLYWQAPAPESALLLVVTQSNWIYGLDARTGKEVWSRSLGTPVPISQLGCGNIDPLGVTGTPAIDETTQSVYVDAMVGDASGPHHLIFALSLLDGSVRLGWPVDIADALKSIGQNFNARDQNERGALTIMGGMLYVPFGGHFGDCGEYHGWVVGLSLHDPSHVVSWSTRGHGGGIWAPGGISSDGNSLYFSTGNTLDVETWSDGEAVFRLPADLQRSSRTQDYFAPMNWHELDDEDADLGGTNPIVLSLPSGAESRAVVLALGKDGHAYLLDQRDLGGIGGSLAAETVSNQAIRTSPASYPGPDGVFVAFQGDGARCPSSSRSGLFWLAQRLPRRLRDSHTIRSIRNWLGEVDNALTVLKIRATPHAPIETAWCGALTGEGAPIVTTTDGRANPIVWILGAEGDNKLHGFRGDTGEPLFTEGSDKVMTGLHHFQTLIAGTDRLYVGADGRVYAFAF